MSTAKKQTCFIIMPITTPGYMKEEYRDGENHFKHVLDCLIIPSVEKAGFVPITPKVVGAELIHADIIKNLETADLVLCDMSCLNPNVFFEFGIRTALNKPICLVKDDLTLKVPIDTNIINNHTYKSKLDPWELDDQIKSLAEHIEESLKRNEGINSLWKYAAY